MFHLIEHLVQSPPEELRRIASPDLKAGDGAIRLSGSSHAETALAGRVDIHITDNVGVVEPLVVERSRKGDWRRWRPWEVQSPGGGRQPCRNLRRRRG